MARTSLTPEVAAYALSGVAEKDLAAQVMRLAERDDAVFSADTADVIAGVIEATALSQQAQVDFLARLQSIDRPLCRYLSARMSAAQGNLGNALEQLSATLSALAAPDAALLLLRARWQVRLGRFAEAARDLSLAVATNPPYAFYVRSERLFEKVIEKDGMRSLREVRLAVLSSSTTALLVPVLRAVCFARGIKVSMYEPPFGMYRQEILDPASGLYDFRPALVLLLVNVRDLQLPPSGGAAEALRFCEELRSLWKTLQARNPCHIVQVGFESSAYGSWGSLEDSLSEGRRRVVQRANDRLALELPAGVSFLNVNGLGHASSLDSEQEWYASRQFPRASELPAFAGAVCAQFRAALGLSSKVLVLDLDNTLWGGVIGEDGLHGIRVGPGSAEGEAHQALQTYAKELKARGILLAACSKNELVDAEAPFRSHQGMVLKREDFAAFKANWEDKASNLRTLAHELSLGLESFVFIDDNPLERAWVRDNLSQVIVPECGSSPTFMLDALRQGRFFESVALTAEDLDRQLSYAASAAMRSAESGGTASLEEFLNGLGMVCEQGPVDTATLARVTQLINKTNQFNLTTRRYSAEQVKQMAESPEWWCRWFRLIDRFGDHGLTGLILARQGGPAWYLDTWLMSCRILGRRMEDFMCASLLAAAAAGRAVSVMGEYVPTEKNALVRDLLPRMGFVATARAGEYRFDLASPSWPTSPWIARSARGG